MATALLKRLREVAWGNGIHTFTAVVLSENSAMLEVLSELGWRRVSRIDGPEVDVTFDLANLVDGCARA